MRSRWIRFTLILLVIFLGLLSRKMSASLPNMINTYLGDSLWALMIYLMMGLVFTKWSIQKVGAVALFFCYFVECSQLYHAAWIDSIRNTIVGGLVLGFGFLWSDMVAYTLGVGFGVAIERMLGFLQSRKTRSV